MRDIRWLMVLTENDAIVDQRDLDGLVHLAVTAERNGIDAVMLSEHVVLGRDSGAAGEMVNRRDYAAPGNQQPSYAWPSSIVLLSAIAQATERARLVAGAIIAPAAPAAAGQGVRHARPALARTARGAPDRALEPGRVRRARGAVRRARPILDEQLEVLALAWGPYPISHEGTHFPFRDVSSRGQPPRKGRPSGSAVRGYTHR